MEDPPMETEITRDGLRQSLANTALEGLFPDTETLTDLEAMAEGKLSGDAYRKKLKARFGDPGDSDVIEREI
ncbi:hypothetical protein ACFSSA_07880 [Luteolibacter algae]|uniref:Antitoxin VbhA domain-containing protein n=2 Tax=Luteolibacter algae TaxID=454151 RepID=A0ABW5D7M7_9BACT